MVWIPAHIIPHAEGVLLAHVPNPISAEEELVEFLGLPAGDYGILAVKRKYIHPYNAAFKDKGGTQQKLSFTQAQDSDCGQKWSPSYAAHMEEVFRKKYSSVSVAKSVYDNVMAAAAHYLK